MTTLDTTSSTDPQDLAPFLTGAVHLPGTPGYAALATPWNVAAVSAPVAVVAAADAEDVVTAVRYAESAGLDIAVQATGHGARPYSRPTLLVHTGALTELTIDPDGASARAGAGIRWQDVLDAAAPHGLSGLAGSAPDVGVVGYLTGGGLSPMGRSFGWAADLVTAFDVVTGDGELRRATPTQNASLYWGLRGGKGALGIVTAVEFGLLRLADIYGGALFFDGADARSVLQAWREWSLALPEQASTSVALLRLPEAPMVPPPLAGRLTVAVRFAWTGDHAEGERVLAPMTGAAPVIFGGVRTMSCTALGMIHADPVDPMPVQERSELLRELTAEAVDTLVGQAGPDSPSPQIVVEVRLLGGALAAQPEWPSAVCHRDAAYTLLAVGIDVPPVRAATAEHAAGLMASMAPWVHGGLQVNFAGSDDPAVIARAYDAGTLRRLGELAETYDPHHRLTAGHAVRAAAGASSR